MAQEPASYPDAGFQPKARSHYFAGNVDSSRSIIEGYMRDHPRHGKDDSVFIAKYLSVIYTADPASRDEGERYMRRWLALEPSADIADMYASEDVDALFQRLKAEIRKSEARALAKMGSQDTASRPGSADLSHRNAPAPAPEPRSIGRNAWLLGGGAATLLAVGASAWIYYSDEPKAPSPVREHFNARTPESPAP